MTKFTIRYKCRQCGRTYEEESGEEPRCPKCNPKKAAMTDYLKKLRETPIETYYPEDSRDKIESRQVALVARALCQLENRVLELEKELNALKNRESRRKMARIDSSSNFPK